MKEFAKDYMALLKENGKFYKKHWKGCIVLTAVGATVEFVAISIKEKNKTKKEEE